MSTKSFYDGTGSLRVPTKSYTIENLPSDISEATIKSVFSKFGIIENISFDYSSTLTASSAKIEFKEIPLNSIYTETLLISGKKVYVVPKKVDTLNSLDYVALSGVDFSSLLSKIAATFPKPRAISEDRDMVFDLDWVELGTYSQRTFYSEWTSDSQSGYGTQTKFIIDQSKSKLLVFFKIEPFLLRANIEFEHIKDTILVEKYEEDKGVVLSIRNKIPPRLWFTNSQETLYNISGRPRYVWRRLIDHSQDNIFQSSEDKNPIFPPYKNIKAFNFGVFLTWRVALNLKATWEDNKILNLNCLSNFNLLNIPIQYVSLKHKKISPKEPVYFPRVLPFPVQYSLESLFSLNLTVYHAQSYSFLKLLKTLPVHKVTRVVERIWAEDVKILDLFDYFTKELANPAYLQHAVKTPTHNALVRKVIITPTKMVILPPVFEVTNRILRKFKQFEDRFLRVTFEDDNLRQLNSNEVENQHIFKRVFKALYYGISFAGRNYKFLAFSSSQLREHGCWFFADTPELKVEDIHKFMGNFSEIHNIAKYAARMGQSFSSSRDGTKLTDNDFDVIPDIVCGKYTFSDGVGKISSHLMKKISDELSLGVAPSAIQFRMGGFKGVLSVCPELPDNMVHFRESQRKFDSEHSTIEVIRKASFSASHLNRQLIVILSSLGVSDAVFVKLQDNMVSDLKDITTDVDQARRCLVKYYDSFGISASLLKLLNTGFLSTTDSYLKNCLRLIGINIKSALKQKARIYVNKGAFLIGVMDETGTLESNQIFVCCTDPMSPNLTDRIITSKCIVARNPAFHPGDIQVVQAVDSPKLHHLKNVVVFSSKGDRDIPSMLSGGDLDGDQFTVIWDEQLIPATTYLAMEPLPALPKYVEKVQITDVVGFFVEYIINDNLGQIANAHLAHSDFSNQGVFDSKCLTLAQLHSRAVDFSKSGIKADFQLDYKAFKFPDFMEKYDKPQYVSQKVLGKLYRRVGVVEVDFEAGFGPDDRLILAGSLRYLEQAIQVKLEYDAAIRSLMNQFGILTEFELVTGCILRHHGMIKKSLFQVREMVLNTVRDIIKDFNNRFYEEFTLDSPTVKTSSLDNPSFLDKASAWYYVSYSKQVQKLTGSDLTTFAWCIQELFINILKSKNSKLNLTTAFSESTKNSVTDPDAPKQVESFIYPTQPTKPTTAHLVNIDTIQNLLNPSDGETTSNNVQLEGEIEAIFQKMHI